MVVSALFYKNIFLACANPIKNNCLLVKRKPGRNFSGPFSSNHFAYACYEKKKFNHVDLRYCLNSIFTQHFILVDHHFSTRFMSLFCWSHGQKVATLRCDTVQLCCLVHVSIVSPLCCMMFAFNQTFVQHLLVILLCYDSLAALL